MANEFIARNGITSLGNIVVSGSITTTGTVAISGSIASASFATSASFAATASSADNLLVRNTLTAQTLVVQTITSSVDFVTGSTRFGTLLTNTHVFSGSVTMNPGGLFVSSSGNVGIGTTIPSRKLSIEGADIWMSIKVTGNKEYLIGQGTSDALRFFDASLDTERMRITSGGNVLIGTTTDRNFKLVAEGTDNNNLVGSYNTTSGASLRIQSNQTINYIVSAINPLQFEVSGAIRMSILTNGNTGIGTTSPSTALHVVGTTTINGDDGSLYQRAVTANAAVYWDIRNSANTRRAYVGFGGTSSTLFDIANSDGGDIRFLSAGVERVRIEANGNTQVIGADNQTTNGGYNTFGNLYVASATAQGTGIGGSISIGGRFNGAGAYATFARIQGKKENSSSGQTGGYLAFEVNTDVTNLLTERMRINSSGQITTPFQPFASLGLSTSFTSVGNIITWQQIHYNVGSCYNSSTGLFTCPIAGKYLMSIMCMTDGIDQTLDIELRINGATSNTLVPYQGATGGFYNQVSGMTMLTLQANDTIGFRLNAGTIYGSSAGRHSAVVFALMG